MRVIYDHDVLINSQPFLKNNKILFSTMLFLLPKILTGGFGKYINHNWHQLKTTVEITSKQINWLFSNNLINGNDNNGKKSVSPNIDDQWANADNILKWFISQENKFQRVSTVA